MQTVVLPLGWIGAEFNCIIYLYLKVIVKYDFVIRKLYLGHIWGKISELSTSSQRVAEWLLKPDL